jgi:glutaredoxin-like protein DUF836
VGLGSLSGPPVVVLYGRDGCHLCEEARAAILELRRELPPFHLREVDIESDPALHAAYLERIPVVEVAGGVVSELGLEPAALERALVDASSRRW